MTDQQILISWILDLSLTILIILLVAGAIVYLLQDKQ
jgi:hypothetical protein